MRFALSTGSLYTYGLDRVFALAAEAGFDGIEVLIDPRFDTRQPVYLRQLMERYGLPILSVHAPFRPRRLAAWPRTQPESIAATAEIARAVGAGVIVVHLPYWTERAYLHWLRNDPTALR
jgi:sugar phosphate isomerase/epimerase